VPPAAVLLAIGLHDARKVDEAPRILPDPEPPPYLTAEQIMQVVEQNRRALKWACWSRSTFELANEAVIVQFTVDSRGTVESIKPQGTDLDLAMCVAKEVRTWRFPCASSMPIELPLQFVRE
jgi:hypothetical protein